MSRDEKRDEAERLLARALGPKEREVSCEQCFELLDRYVELEVAGEDADAALSGMRTHFEGCPACADDHRSLLDLVRSGRDR